jgi:hypothetical protein
MKDVPKNGNGPRVQESAEVLTRDTMILRTNCSLSISGRYKYSHWHGDKARKRETEIEQI